MTCKDCNGSGELHIIHINGMPDTIRCRCNPYIPPKEKGIIMPLANNLYKHYRNEREYTVLHFAKCESTEQHLTVYQDIITKEVYVRPTVNFFEKVTNENDIQVNRFERVIK